MAFLPQGSSAQVAISAGQSIAVGAVRGATANVTYPVGYPKGPSDTVVNGTETFGPFATATTVTVYAAQGTAEYVTGTNPVCTDGPVALATDPFTGEVTLPNPNDSTVVFALTPKNIPVVFPDEIYTATSAGGVGVMAGPCYLVGIRAQSVTAGPITITVYDNIASAAGVVLYTGSLNTGGEASIPTPVLAFTGVFLSFTGTATFDFSLRSAA